MFDISAKVPTSNNPAGIATRNPATQVANAGVRNFGCTLLNTSGSSRSRDMANQTRACPSWNTRMDEIMPTSAPMSTASCTQCKRSPPGPMDTRFSALTTGAASPAIDRHGTNPVSTTATPIYNTVHMTRVARMPMGTFRRASLHSSLAVETESNPI